MAAGLLIPVLAPWLELWWYDVQMVLVRELEGNPPPHPALRVVGLDEASHREVGGWTPQHDARALRNLLRGGAAVVLYHRPEARPDQPGFEDLLEVLRASRRIVLGGEVSPSLARAAPSAPAEVVTDPDGTVRRAFLAHPVEGGRHRPAAALLALARLRGILPEAIRCGPSGIRLGDLWIPTWPDNTLPVRFHYGEGGRGSRRYLAPVSCRRLLDREDRFLKKVAGALVVLGDNTYQATDHHSTPVGEMKGVEVQASLLDTLLSGWFLRRVPAAVSSAFLLGFCGLLAWLLSALRAVPALFTWGGATVLYGAAAVLAFQRGWWLPFWPAFAGGLAVLVTVVTVQWLRTAGYLGRFLGQEVARTLAGGDEIALGGQQKVASILFASLPEFLREAERRGEPAHLERRNRYAALVREVCRCHGGWVMDYQGEAQMVAFGVREGSSEGHAAAAVIAALELEQAARKLLAGWGVEAGPLAIHCGINTGPVAVGWVGSERKMEFAAIGDTTNVAARLLGAAQKLAVGVLISESTRQAAGDRLHVEPLQPVSLKGKARPLPVFRVRAVRPSAEEGG